MKKMLALILLLCMITAVLPVAAESETGFGLDSIISDILKSEDSNEEKTGRLLTLISDLKKQFTNHEAEFTVLLSTLDQKLENLAGSDGKDLGTLVSGLKKKLAGSSDINLSGLVSGLKGKLNGDGDGDSGLGSLLSGLFSNSGSEDVNDEWTEEDEQEFNDTIDKLNKESEAATGENVPNRKAAESIDEFYGSWTETKFIFNGEEYDMSDCSEGVFIAENTYYITVNGEKDPDYFYPETAELSLKDGVLKVKRGEDNWTTYALTKDGEIVIVSSSLLCYFTRTED